MKSLRLLVGFIMLLAIFAFAGLLWLNVSPVSVVRFLPEINSYLAVYDAKLAADDLRLSFEKRFVLKGKNISVHQKQHGSLAFGTLDVALANRGIVLGNIQPKHVRAAGVRGEIFVTEKAEKTETVNAAPDVITILQGLNTNASLKRLRTFELTDVAASVVLPDAVWEIKQGAVQLVYYTEQPLDLVVTGHVGQWAYGVERDETVFMPVYAHGEYMPGADYAEVSVRLDSAGSEWVKPLLPVRLQNYVQTAGQIKAMAKLVKGNAFIEPAFGLVFGETVLDIPEAYKGTRTFRKIALEGAYDAALDILQIDQLLLTDDTGWDVTLAGTVEGIQASPTLNLTLQAPAEDGLERVLNILPDAALVSTIPWLRERTSGVKIANLSATYVGDPTALPDCGDACGLTIEADILAGEVKPFKDAPTLTDITGKFSLRGDGIQIAADKGVWRKQNASSIIVEIRKIFTPGDNELWVGGKASGDLADLLKNIELSTGVGGVPPSVAQHSSVFSITVPLFEDKERKPKLNELGVDVQSTFKNVTITPPGLNGEVLKSAEMKLNLKLPQLKLQGDGVFAQIPINLDWRQNLARKDSGIKATLKGRADPQRLQQYFKLDVEPDVLAVRGETPFSMELKQERADAFDMSLAADLTLTALSSTILSIHKPAGERMDVEIEGQLRGVQTGRTELDFGLIKLGGEDVEGLGSAYYAPGTFPRVSFAPLQIGLHELRSLDIQQDSLSLNGEVLDLRGVDLFANGKSKLKTDMAVDAELGNVFLQRGGSFQNVKLKMKREEGRWRMADVSGEVSSNPFVVKLRPLNGGEHLRVDLTNTGVLLRNLGIYDHIRQGKLQAEMTFGPEKTGDGYILVENARALKMPVIFKLVDLLSLQSILDSQAGLRINSVRIPMRFEGDNIHVSYGVWDGASIDMKFDGYYSNPADKTAEINFDGQIIPAVALNQSISKIPLIGDLLAGSQDGVLVADFKVKGPVDNPEVSVKPLSLITPGILKDLFR